VASAGLLGTTLSLQPAVANNGQYYQEPRVIEEECWIRRWLVVDAAVVEEESRARGWRWRR
jgi:hypothetical protein